MSYWIWAGIVVFVLAAWLIVIGNRDIAADETDKPFDPQNLEEYSEKEDDGDDSDDGDLFD